MQDADSYIEAIIDLANKGMTDYQIGLRLGKHYKTIAYHRRQHSLPSGRSHQAALTEQRRKLTMNKRSYKLLPLQEQVTRGRLRHGLNAYAPITCQGVRCPYRTTCKIPAEDLVVGMPCVIENAVIAALTVRYNEYFQPAADDIAAIVRIRWLIDLEVKQLRCDRLTTVNPEPLYITEDKDGNICKVLNPLLQYDLMIKSDRSRVLQCLLG